MLVFHAIQGLGLFAWLIDVSRFSFPVRSLDRMKKSYRILKKVYLYG